MAEKKVDNELKELVEEFKRTLQETVHSLDGKLKETLYKLDKFADSHLLTLNIQIEATRPIIDYLKKKDWETCVATAVNKYEKPNGRTWKILFTTIQADENDAKVATIEICSQELPGISTQAETVAFTTLQEILKRYVGFPYSKFNCPHAKANNIILVNTSYTTMRKQRVGDICIHVGSVGFCMISVLTYLSGFSVEPA